MPSSRLDFARDHALRVCGQQQPHDPQARLGAHRAEHVGIAGNLFRSGLGLLHFEYCRNLFR